MYTVYCQVKCLFSVCKGTSENIFERKTNSSTQSALLYNCKCRIRIHSFIDRLGTMENDYITVQMKAPNMFASFTTSNKLLTASSV